MLNIAHRGARSLAPENTISAAQKAFAVGADMWELDTGLSADNQLIIMHDDTLERTTNVAEVFPEKTKALLHEFTYEDICKLEAGSHFVKNDPFGQIASGAVNPQELVGFAKEPIPTLEQALVFTKENHWKVNVEIKSIFATRKDTSIVDQTIKMIHAMNLQASVILSSFNHDYLRKAKQLAPDISTGWLTTIGTQFHRPSVVKANCNAYHPSLIGLNGLKIRHFQRHGLDVNVWTVNQQADMRKLLSWNVNGIITDFPQTLHELCKVS